MNTKCLKNDNRDRNRVTFLLFFLLFLVGIVIKVYLWQTTHYLSRDSSFYLMRIKTWYEKGGTYYFENCMPMYFFPPFIVFLGQLIMHLGISEIKAMLLLNIVLGSLISPIVYLIVLEIYHKQKYALCGALIILFHPMINRLSIEAQRDIGYLFFSALFFLFLLYAHFRSGNNYFFVAGGSLSCAFLFRVESLELLLFAVVLICIARRNFIRNIRNVLYLALSFCLFTSLAFFVMGMRSKDISIMFDCLFRETYGSAVNAMI